MRYDNCSIVDRELKWCATEVNPDESYKSFGWCDGQCKISINLVEIKHSGSPCCRDEEICFTVDVDEKVLGFRKIAFFNHQLNFVYQADEFFYSGFKGAEATFRYQP